MNIDIKQIARTIARKEQGLVDPQLVYPARDWALTILITLTLIVGAVVFSVVEYRSYTNVGLNEEVVMTMVPYRAALVEQAIAKYQARAEEHARIIASFTGDTTTIREGKGGEGDGLISSEMIEPASVIAPVHGEELKAPDTPPDTESVVGIPDLAP
jgi:hypothetical protein